MKLITLSSQAERSEVFVERLVMKLERDNIEIYVDQVTLVFYWPYIAIEKRRVHIAFHSQITYHDRNNWEVNKSLVMRILGFGIGIAHKHCLNPNVKDNVA